MTVAQQVDRDLLQALRERDQTRLATLRLLKAAAKNAEVAKRAPLTDSEYEDVVRRQVKMRREAATEYERAGRSGQATQELAELDVLQAYLPEQLDADAIEALVRQAIADTGATGPADLGKVMSHAMRAAQGRADGAQVNQLARTLLAGQGG